MLSATTWRVCSLSRHTKPPARRRLHQTRLDATCLLPMTKPNVVWIKLNPDYFTSKGPPLRCQKVPTSTLYRLKTYVCDLTGWNLPPQSFPPSKNNNNTVRKTPSSKGICFEIFNVNMLRLILPTDRSIVTWSMGPLEIQCWVSKTEPYSPKLPLKTRRPLYKTSNIYNAERKRETELVCWCFEPSQLRGVTPGLNTNSYPSLSYSAHKSFNINHNISTTQLF